MLVVRLTTLSAFVDHISACVFHSAFRTFFLSRVLLLCRPYHPIKVCSWTQTAFARNRAARNRDLHLLFATETLESHLIKLSVVRVTRYIKYKHHTKCEEKYFKTKTNIYIQRMVKIQKSQPNKY